MNFFDFITLDEIDGLQRYRHGGWWGTTAAYFPELDAAFACTVNQRQESEVRDDIVRAALALVRNAIESSSE